MRLTRSFLLSVLACTAASAAIVQTVGERIELLNWSDPERAVRLIDAAATPAERRLLDVPMLEAGGIVYIDSHRDAEVQATLSELERLGAQGDAVALAAEHYVRAYGLHQHEDYAAATAELNQIDVDSLTSEVERYRWSSLRGDSLRRLGQAEAAEPDLQESLRIAEGMHDDARSLHALLALADLDADRGDLTAAADRLTTADTLASMQGDEATQAAVEGGNAKLAARRGDHAAERRASQAALEHATAADSPKMRALALIAVGDSYLHARDYREAFKIIKQAKVLVAAGVSGVESTVSFQEGLAQVGMGNIKQGQDAAEKAINDALARNDFVDARNRLHEYADALEHAGYLMMAIQVYQRYGVLSDQLMSSTRQRAFELSATTNDALQEKDSGLMRRS